MQQPRCPLTDEQIKRSHIYNGILLSHKKEWICISSSEEDKTRACYKEWSQSEGEKQISCNNAHIWNIEKMVWLTYL